MGTNSISKHISLLNQISEDFENEKSSTLNNSHIVSAYDVTMKENIYLCYLVAAEKWVVVTYTFPSKLLWNWKEIALSNFYQKLSEKIDQEN